MFTVDGFINKTFETIAEYEEAKLERAALEDCEPQITEITAVLLPASKDVLEEKVLALEKQLTELCMKTEKPKPTKNKEGITVGTLLQGESKGSKYTLEVLDIGYSCSDGSKYASLSGAAEGVSGNKRSGWKFWRNLDGRSIGEAIGRFKLNEQLNPFELP